LAGWKTCARRSLPRRPGLSRLLHDPQRMAPSSSSPTTPGSSTDLRSIMRLRRPCCAAPT
jgi:hypothetical protein